MFRYTVVFILIFNSIFVFAQKQHIAQGNLFFRYQLNLKLPKDFKIKTEVEERMFIKPTIKHQQFYVRAVAGKEFKQNWFIGVGFAFFGNSPNDPINESKLIAPEYRPYLEISNNQKITNKFSITNRYKVEGRFMKSTNAEYTSLVDGFSNSCRFRYQIGLEYTPYRNVEKELKLKMYDEVMVQIGKSVGKNIFDQNRVGLAVQYNFNKKVGAELSYIFWLQQLKSGDKVYSRQILRFTLINNFSISKKHKEEKQ